MHKPHNRISHWFNVLWKKIARLNHVYPSVLPLHTQSHSSWCSKGTSVKDLCNPRTPILGFSWRTWRRRSQVSGKQQVSHHTPGLWVRLHWKHSGWGKHIKRKKSSSQLNLFIPLLIITCSYLKPFTKSVEIHWTDTYFYPKSLVVLYIYLMLFKTNSAVNPKELIDNSIINLPIDL